MRFLGRLPLLFLNVKEFILGVDSKMEQATVEAGKVWVEEALKHVPVWSGASRATFEQLANAVGVSVDIDIARGAPDRVALGRLNSRGGVERIGRGKYRFFYENSLGYLADNERRNVPAGEGGVIWGLKNPGPYNFVAQANAAVERLSSKIELPKINIDAG